MDVKEFELYEGVNLIEGVLMGDMLYISVNGEEQEISLIENPEIAEIYTINGWDWAALADMALGFEIVMDVISVPLVGTAG